MCLLAHLNLLFVYICLRGHLHRLITPRSAPASSRLFLTPPFRWARGAKEWPYSEAIGTIGEKGATSWCSPFSQAVLPLLGGVDPVWPWERRAHAWFQRGRGFNKGVPDFNEGVPCVKEGVPGVNEGAPV